MGHVTDGGLEPEPNASIKAAAGAVNGILARFEGIFGDFGRFGGFEGAGGGGMAALMSGCRGMAPAPGGRLARRDSGLRRNDGCRDRDDGVGGGMLALGAGCWRWGRDAGAGGGMLGDGAGAESGRRIKAGDGEGEAAVWPLPAWVGVRGMPGSGPRRWWRWRGGGRLRGWDGDAEQGRGIPLCCTRLVVKRSCRQDGSARAFRDFPKEVGVPGVASPISGDATPAIPRKSGSGIGVKHIVITRLKDELVVDRIVFQCDIETQIAPSRQLW